MSDSSLEAGAESRPSSTRLRAPMVIPLLFVLFAIGAAGYGYYLEQRHTIERAAHEQLAIIADLKAKEIAHWLRERQRDAATLYYAHLGHALQTFMANPAAPGVWDDTFQWLASVARSYNYNAVILLDRNGQAVLAFPSADMPVAAPTQALVQQALRTPQVVLSDLLYDEDGSPHLDVIVPLLGEHGRAAPPVGALVLRIDPSTSLFPLLQTWPPLSPTAEILMIHRTGNEIVLLTDPRHRQDAALPLRLALDAPVVTAALVSQGKELVMAGIDHRGVPVLATIRHIDDSPWQLVAKVDRQEIDAPIRESAMRTLLAVLMLMAISVLATWSVWRRQSEAALRLAKRDLEARVRERTAELQQEIAERKHVEGALRLNEQRFRTTLKNSPITVFNQDRALRYIWIGNPLPGFSPERVLGKRDVDIMERPEDAEMVEALKRRVLETGEGMRQEVCIRIGGAERWYVLTIEPLWGTDAQAVGITGAAVDISVYMQLQARLQQQAEQLKEGDRRKDEFLAMLAHELRNPLAPIRNAIELLRLQGPPNGDLRWEIGVLDRQVEHMTRLVDDLLDVARITRGRIRLRKEPVDLAAIVSRAVEAITPLVGAHGQELIVSLPPQAVQVNADPHHLQQVVANLLNNACKYTPEGGYIRLTVEQEGAEAVIRVWDTGIGIPADILPRVFDPFVQADHSLARSEGGLGMGLTLVRTLVEMHDGSVQALSAGPGQGSEFVVRLPLAAQSSQQQYVSNRDRSQRAGGYSGLRILVVDDHADEADSLTKLLDAMGHEAHCAYDGEAALNAVRTLKPQVVFLDLGLPGMDGYEVARRLRAEHPQEDILLVALTGYGRDEDIRRTEEAGFDHHLLKPIDLEALRRLLAAADPA